MNTYNVFVRLNGGGQKILAIQANDHHEAFIKAKSIIGETNWSYAGIPVEQIRYYQAS